MTHKDVIKRLILFIWDNTLDGDTLGIVLGLPPDMLEKYNRIYEEYLDEFAKHLREDDEYLDEITDKYVSIVVEYIVKNIN